MRNFFNLFGADKPKSKNSRADVVKREQPLQALPVDNDQQRRERAERVMEALEVLGVLPPSPGS